eukprot:SAG11_NODE_27562_length_331_cov_0.887931_1_plen_48_part_01
MRSCLEHATNHATRWLRARLNGNQIGNSGLEALAASLPETAIEEFWCA